MGRARRLHRSRQGDGWKTPLRFAVGTEVMCMYNERWARGRVVAHHYEEPKGVFYPYQIRLETPEVLIYAPADEDDCIQKAVSFRFEIGALVECNLGDADGPDWETGHVVAYNFQQPKGVFNPYQIKLLNGALIYAPADEDTLIKKAEIPVASPCPDEGNRACSGNMTIVSKDPVTPDGINANQHTTKKRATAPSCTFAFENPGADDCGYVPWTPRSCEERPLVLEVYDGFSSEEAGGEEDYPRLQAVGYNRSDEPGIFGIQKLSSGRCCNRTRRARRRHQDLARTRKSDGTTQEENTRVNQKAFPE